MTTTMTSTRGTTTPTRITVTLGVPAMSWHWNAILMFVYFISKCQNCTGNLVFRWTWEVAQMYQYLFIFDLKETCGSPHSWFHRFLPLSVGFSDGRKLHCWRTKYASVHHLHCTCHLCLHFCMTLTSGGTGKNGGL